jgi:NADH dehydrogenase (ubiquinone) 1 alpha subcomplex subunit 9
MARLTHPPHLSRNFKFPEVHVEGARRIARIAHLCGVSRFVHVSHLNARHDSPSKVYRHKASGEEAVKEAFPGATVARPSWMYGHEDRLLNSVATHPWLFRLNHGDTLVKPVHVGRVTDAVQTYRPKHVLTEPLMCTCPGPRRR